MILSDKTLKSLIDKKEIVITPLSDNAIQPASIDCRLGDKFLVLEDTMESIRMDEPIKYREIITNEITIPPKSFILGTTMEYLELPSNLTVFIEGRSSIGRMGLFIENAGWIDPGFKGNLTLELYNANSLPIKLIAGRRICQFVFCQMDQTAEIPYGDERLKSKYQGQASTVGSLISQDTESKK